jgi:hypothetical protein
MVGHADRLERGGAEPIHGRARNLRGQPGEQCGAPAEVHPLLLLRKAAADHHVDDLGAVELGDLVQRGVDRERDEVVGPGVDQRALAGPPDGGADGGDDDCVRQRRSLP